MRIYFRDDDTLVVAASDSVEAMALKYWMKEYAEHGNKVFEVDPTVPLLLGAPE